MIKITLVFVIAVLLSCEGNPKTPYSICTISGHIYCNGKPVKYLRPFLVSPEYPGEQISIYPTHEDGDFELSTTGYYLLHNPVQIVIRHVCPVPGVPFKKQCAIPYSITKIIVDHRNKTDVYIDVNLEKYKDESDRKCL